MTRILLSALVLSVLPACRTYSNVADPLVLVQTRGGSELGVSTSHGVVFLGSTARAGEANLVVWFGDGPSIEPSLIEPIGGGLYTLDVPLALPSMPLSFRDPDDGERVELRGRGPSGPWRSDAAVVKHPAVAGILLEPPPEFRTASDQTGAGVFVLGENDRPRLLGLVSGRLVLIEEGQRRTFLTVVGPADLWRLVAYRRDLRETRLQPVRPDLRW